MSIHWLATRLTVISLVLAGCGGDDDDAGAPPPAPEPFEIEGPWLYLGPSDGPHTLTIERTSMTYADLDGKWSSHWTIQAYDNVLNHFQVAFASADGAYLPMGQTMSGAYDVSGTLLTVQLANGMAYPVLQGAGTCTSPADGMPLPDCRLYVDQ
jgi:hypothetical protein